MWRWWGSHNTEGEGNSAVGGLSSHTLHPQLECLEQCHAQFCEHNSKMSTYTHLYYVSGTATVIHGLWNWIAGVMQMKIKPNLRICFMW